MLATLLVVLHSYNRILLRSVPIYIYTSNCWSLEESTSCSNVELRILTSALFALTGVLLRYTRDVSTISRLRVT